MNASKSRKPFTKTKSSRKKPFFFVAIIGLVVLSMLLQVPTAAGSDSWLSPLATWVVYLPIFLKEEQPTATPTATGTATATETSTPTGTITPPTVTPTITLTPTSTRTGTITPAVTITMVVSPGSAKINEKLTFTIIVVNSTTATGAATNAVLSDSFPSYVDVESVASSRGTETKSSHAASVTIGTILPGESVTITIIVKINSSASKSESVTNTATVTYDNTSRSASRIYNIVVTSTLPGTGQLALDAPQVAGASPLRTGLLNLLQGLLLVLLGSAGMLFSVGKRPSRQQMRFLGRSILPLMILGLVALGAAACAREKTPPAKPTDTSQPPSATPTRTLMPYMPASHFSTPEAVVATLPSFPVPSPTVLNPTPLEGQEQPDTSPVTRLMIPALGLDTEVKYVPFDGLSWLITGLRHEVAWLGGSSWPGLGSNTVLAGHVTVAGLGNGPFRFLEKLTSGEIVVLYTEENMYTYQVREQFTVDPVDIGITQPTVKPQITLITCTDWDDQDDFYRSRRILVADLVRTDPIRTQGSQ